MVRADLVSHRLTWDDLRSLCSPEGGRFRIRNLYEASRFCRRWARRHYENFPIASLLLPAHLRPHVAHLYAFARLADDIADAPNAPPSEKLELLKALEDHLLHAVHTAPQAGNPVLIAFSATLRDTGLPILLVQRLLTAFRYDADFRPFSSWSEVEWYCHHSATPIGEALLFLHQSCTPTALCASNALCIALQLLNFWQDLSLDLPQGRLYLPWEVLRRYGIVEPEELWQNSSKLHRCLNDVADVIIRWLSRAAQGLPAIVHPRLRWQARVTLAAAFRLLERLRQLGTTVLFQRPQLGVRDAIALLQQYYSLQYP